MRILALDQATVTGWAVGEPSRRLIASGSFPAKMGLYHMVGFWTEKLRTLFEEHEPEFLAIEQPFIGPMNSDITEKLYALYALAHLVAGEHTVGVMPCNIGKWRKHFYSGPTPRPPKGTPSAAWYKQMALDECRRRGWEVGGHDEAEACGILDFAMGTLCPETRDQQALF